MTTFRWDHILKYKIVDGDTIQIRVDLGAGISLGEFPEDYIEEYEEDLFMAKKNTEVVSIRIEGIDTPEVRGPQAPVGKLVTNALIKGWLVQSFEKSFKLVDGSFLIMRGKPTRYLSRLIGVESRSKDGRGRFIGDVYRRSLTASYKNEGIWWSDFILNNKLGMAVKEKRHEWTVDELTEVEQRAKEILCSIC